MPETNGAHRVAVVLSGGGAKGAYEVGVLKALQERGIEPQIYCGTSVGSFNCAMLVSGRSLAEVESVWRHLSTGDVFKLRYDPKRLLSLDPLLPLKFAIGSVRLLGGFVAETLKSDGNWWETIDLDSFLLDTSPLGKLISSNVDISALRKSGKDIYVALTRLKPVESNALEIVGRENVTHSHILASCSLPFIFPQVIIGKETFCDGGVVMNSPLKPAIDAGADEIYVLDLTPPPRTYRDATLPLAYQVLSAQFSAALNSDVEFAEDINSRYLAAHKEGRLVNGRLEVTRFDTSAKNFGALVPSRFRYLRIITIRPSSDLGGIGGFLKFNPEIASKMIASGEKDGRKALEHHQEREVVGADKTAVNVVIRK
jgi:NTE family protein